jgi:hypothetical protein
MRARSTPAVLLGAIVGVVAASTVQAQSSADVAGVYCLRGVREVGSCLRLSDEKKFEYFLAYGAYDERSEGHWNADGGDVVLDSPPYDKPPTFAFKGLAKSEAFDVVVLGKGGNPLNGIDVRTTCDGRTVDVGVTGTGGFRLDCSSPPTEVALGLSMFGVPYQAIKVPAAPGADRGYQFTFDAGDLGNKRFASARLRREGRDTLVMTYANPAIAELDGKTFTYERDHE